MHPECKEKAWWLGYIEEHGAPGSDGHPATCPDCSTRFSPSTTFRTAEAAAEYARRTIEAGHHGEQFCARASARRPTKGAA